MLGEVDILGAFMPRAATWFVELSPFAFDSHSLAATYITGLLCSVDKNWGRAYLGFMRGHHIALRPYTALN